MNTYSRFGIRQAVIGGLLSLTLFLLAACQPAATPASPTATPAPTATPVPAAQIPEATITLNAEGFVISENFPGGIVRVTFENQTDKDMDVSLARVLPGADTDEIIALAPDPEATIPLMQMISFMPSFNPLPAGGSAEAIIDFRTGEFVTDAVQHSDGPPIVGAQHFNAVFQATELVGTVEPQADVRVDMANFAFAMPDSVQARKQLWEVSNSGDQWHMLLLITLSEGATVEQAMAFVNEAQPSGPPPFTMVEGAGVPPIGPGERVWIEVDLAPGTYTVICPLPDVAAMMQGEMPMSHADHGMHRTLTVTE